LYSQQKNVIPLPREGERKEYRYCNQVEIYPLNKVVKEAGGLFFTAEIARHSNLYDRLCPKGL